MTEPSSDLLRALGGIGRPAGLDGPVGAGHAPIAAAGVDFASMLEHARRGAVSSGLEVRVGRGVDLTLTDEQRTHLADLADRAEAAGVVNLLVVMEGKALTLDVGSRTITGVQDVRVGPIATGIDGVAFLTAEEGQPDDVVPLPMPAGVRPIVTDSTGQIR